MLPNPDFFEAKPERSSKPISQGANVRALPASRYATHRRFPVEILVGLFSTPVFMIDASCTLVCANSAGLKTLRKAEILQLRGKRVELVQSVSRRRLSELMNLVATEGNSLFRDHGAVVVRLLDKKGRPAVLTAKALYAASDPDRPTVSEIALFLTQTSVRSQPEIRYLTAAFGFTPAEVRLALRLLSGESLNTIGEHLHVSRETLKTQLSSLFAKTGTSRQGELIALLLSTFSVSIL